MSGKEAIESVRAKWPVLFNARKFDELGEWFYADDAYALPPEHAEIRGRKQIVAYFRDVAAGGDAHFELGVIETVAEGDLGYLVGNYVFTSGGKSVKGTTHEAYRRQRDGTWKCVVDMWHAAEPA
jgi:ketosteroid isomerase-like protein